MKRHKPLKRSTKPLKKTQRSWNSTLRTQALKTRKRNRELSPARKSYQAEFLMCQCCCKRKSVDVHEIARGAHRAQAVAEPALWLVLCRPCHEQVGDYSVWPLARQLALKLVADPNRFDLKIFNRVRGRSETAMTLADVAQWLEVK